MFQPGANVYTQGFGSRPENVEVPHLDVRDPSNSEIMYPVGKTWLNTVSKTQFILYGFTAINGVTQANWVSAGSSPSSGITAIADSSGTAVLPDGIGNVYLFGTTNQIDVISHPGFNRLRVSLPNSVITPGDFAVSGSTQFFGGTSFFAGASISNGLAVSGGITSNEDLTVTGTTTLNGNANFHGTSEFFGPTQFDEGFQSLGTISIAGNSTDKLLILQNANINFATTYTFIGPTTYAALGGEPTFPCNTTGGVVTINLGTVWGGGALVIVYDFGGNASANNIVINSDAGAFIFSAGNAPSTTISITQNYGTLQLLNIPGTNNFIVV